MAKTITFGIQKGGVGKSTTTGIVAYMMAQEGKKVLVVDMDSQGNVSDLLTQMDPEEFEGKTVLEALKEVNPVPYIVQASENIDVLPSDDFLSGFAKYLYTEYKEKNKSILLKKALKSVQDQYDYILVDTPPSLGEQMTNAVCASDYVVVLAESSKWAFTSIPRFLTTISFAKKHINKRVKLAGILRTMTDSNARRSDPKAFIKLIGNEYPDFVFSTIIKRKSTVGRLPIEGLEENKDMKSALKDYGKFYDELKERMGVE